ncbi:hypothetical protein [Lysinibacillus mangiferihumi]|uniref:hypothetical protein n=1 Tax=Lysinibacillus mangiferihumi TaxID=1130819 RepID=UPI00142D3AD6|nr:hypothetical protein [Lysinibacillus mangiferihumi]
MKKQAALLLLLSLTWIGGQTNLELSTTYVDTKNPTSEIKPLDLNDPTPDPK